MTPERGARNEPLEPILSIECRLCARSGLSDLRSARPCRSRVSLFARCLTVPSAGRPGCLQPGILMKIETSACFAQGGMIVHPAAQLIAARGGEVVARASAYNDPYFASPEAADQQGWKQLVQQRGRMVTYSVIQSTFNQIAGEAFQRMILRSGTPESVITEIKTRYAEALAKA